MSDSVYLHGSERVLTASSKMQDASQQIANSVNQLEDILFRYTREWTQLIERLEKLHEERSKDR